MQTHCNKTTTQKISQKNKEQINLMRQGNKKKRTNPLRSAVREWKKVENRESPLETLITGDRLKVWAREQVRVSKSHGNENLRIEIEKEGFRVWESHMRMWMVNDECDWFRVFVRVMNQRDLGFFLEWWIYLRDLGFLFLEWGKRMSKKKKWKMWIVDEESGNGFLVVKKQCEKELFLFF
jgi:hypothetical protein